MNINFLSYAAAFFSSSTLQQQRKKKEFINSTRVENKKIENGQEKFWKVFNPLQNAMLKTINITIHG
jgi:hypothetical protein